MLYGHARVSTIVRPLTATRPSGRGRVAEPLLNSASDFAEIVLAVLAIPETLERCRIKRTAVGRAGAKAQNVIYGRKQKLTLYQQRETQERLAKGGAQRSVAGSYRVAQSTISRLSPVQGTNA